MEFLIWARKGLRIPQMVHVDIELNREIKEFVVDQIIAVLDFFQQFTVSFE